MPWPVAIREHAGPRAALRPLFELAEDSPPALDAYLDAGRVLAAYDGDRVVGHLQLTDITDAGAAEIKSMAVDPALQGRGIGRALVAAAIALARDEGGALACDEGGATLVVATATADVGNLRFYQRLGFRMRAIERDAFTPATGYPPDLEADGIPVRDRVWLDMPLPRADPEPEDPT
jgi:ribosomal protein S18 acetylase RimI-like enzyme